MNYHSSEDYFLKVEKRFLIAVGHTLCYQQGDVIEMIPQNPYVKLEIPFRTAD